MQRATILFTVLLICFHGFLTSYEYKYILPIQYKWVVQKGGTLKVNGSTNINKFSCKISDYSKPDTILVFKNENTKELLLPMMGNLAIEIKQFNCGNAVMTADLRKTLKSKEYPYLTINFLTLSKLPEIGKLVNDINGWVEIELAGVKKRFMINYTFSSSNALAFHLKGTQFINFSDFNLTPPRKLGGMIRANQRLDVEFQLDVVTIH
ncbi:MAG TPA: hypothetical protein PLW32_03230 [Chitinophagaceae bacterium]|nr:hypothetical protein [Chitinophagaceae bacterium]